MHEMARYQIADELAANDNRVKGIQREIDLVPENPFVSAFYDKYSSAFKLKKLAGKPSPFEAPSKPLRSQEQEQEQEQDKTLLSESDDSNASPAETKPDSNVVKIDSAKPAIPYQQIVDAYHDALPELPSVRLMTDARRRAIKSRWLQTLNSDRGDGTLRYTDAESGIRWWSQYFNHVRNNPHWLGGNDRGWTADFDWLLTSANFIKVLEYRPRASA